jgi:hypothetical protein
MWLRRIGLFGFVSLILAGCLSGQSPNGTINGLVLDPTGGTVPGAEIRIANDATGVQYTGKTNSEGIYVVTNLPPGPYRLQVSKIGFKTLIKPDIILNVQDSLAINFTLLLGAASEVVTVTGGAPLVNTESGSVSTVVDRQFVANMPLNGRSFQDLILLTPGVVTSSPQASANNGAHGEFSVNGQRTESNYYTVDGVSANVGVSTGSAAVPGTSGSMPASTALGTTQALVSLDALEEFRVQSSTYSAEYGRNPGGQFSFVTRSGTNQWHGGAYDYLRNNVFDANDWFNNYFGKPQPPVRQNDFGGTLGGPVQIPHFYDGKDKTFIFFSYEGLRLDQPQAANVTYVPDATLRANTPSPLQQVLNAFPVPNGPNLGNGLAEFIDSWANPSSLDSISVRLDQVVNDKVRVFFRFADTSSNVLTQGTGIFGVASVLNSTDFTTRTFTLGSTSSLSASISNEFRLNYSSNAGTFSATLISFGGATPVNLNQLQGFPGGLNSSPSVQIGLFLGTGFPIMSPHTSSGEQRQWNIVDALTVSRGRHQTKMGFDLRRLDPKIFSANPVATYDYLSATAVRTNSVGLGGGESFAPAYPVYINFSAFVQDEWKLSSRVTLSGGVRWEINPAPGAANGNPPYTVEGSSLSTLTLAPQGTPLWKTSWFNLAPRLGIAYVLRNKTGLETVLRTGGGVFFDTGQQLGSYGYQGPGFSAMTPSIGSLFGSPASFPLPPAQVTPPIVNPPIPPFTNTTVLAFPAHLQLPYTIQWNASIQQALGKSEALTVSYVGSHAARLLEESQVNALPFNANFGAIFFVQNGLTADYNALQIQFQRRLSHGLQALASSTWAHSIDYGSYNFVVPYQRGNSDFDIRQSFTSALVYDFPNPFKGKFVGAVLHHWGLDDRFSARTGFPVTLQGGLTFDPATGQSYYSGLNIVSGQPLYIYGSQCAPFDNGLECPGGRAINPSAFSLPVGCTPATCPPGTGVGDAPRNFVRGLGAWQMDLALRREFPISDRLKLQFRAEAFNIFNHPNFGMVDATFCSAGPGCAFGQATATLANSLGGLSSLYQMGGPRSLQFALKLVF